MLTLVSVFLVIFVAFCAVKAVIAGQEPPLALRLAGNNRCFSCNHAMVTLHDKRQRNLSGLEDAAQA